MKKIFIAAIMLISTLSIWAQVPQLMSYQAVIRNSSNQLIKNTTVGIQISIIRDSVDGEAVFVETHSVATNGNGLVSLAIGGGILVSGALDTIKWSDAPYYIKTETDPAGGTSYSITSTSQLLSVPFALYAANSGLIGTPNYIPKFTANDTVAPSLIYSDFSYVGIGTNTPTYRLHVNHGGSTGILSKSTSSFSLVDIDGASGDAALRFAKAGVNQWNFRNRPADDNLEIFELGGGGSRVVIQNTTGNMGINFDNPTAKLHVGGTFTATGTKAFTIDHPLDPENKTLSHFAIESPEVLNMYSGTITTDASGKAIVQLPAYFGDINKDLRYQLTVVGTFAQAIISKEVSNNQFEIATSTPNVKVCWEVKGVRNDGYMILNPASAEQMKPANMKGKYIEPKAFNQPESKRVGYIDSTKGSAGKSSVD